MKEILMRTRICPKNAFVSILLALLMVPVPPSRFAWSQDDDNDEEQQTPAPSVPTPKPQQPGQAQPPAAPPVPTTPAQRRLLPPPGQKPAGGGDMVSLNFNRAGAVKAGDNIYRIAPIEKGKGIARPATDDSQGGYAIQIIPLRFFSVTEMKRL